MSDFPAQSGGGDNEKDNYGFVDDWVVRYFCKAFADMDSAYALFSTGDSKGALSEYQAVLKTVPNDVQAQRFVGLCQSNLGQNENAIASFQKVLANPDAGIYKVEAQLYIGWSLQRERKLNEALTELAKISSADKSPVVQDWVAGALISRGDILMEQALTGDVLTAQGKIDEAQKTYLRVGVKGTPITNLETALTRLDASLVGKDKYIAYLNKILLIVDYTPETKLFIERIGSEIAVKSLIK
jgi:tetratricopeptide (TPR) repeat protein